MSVKRYSVNLSVNRSVEVNEILHGSLVKYHDYAALEQRLIESERYGRQTDITIDNLEMKLAQMAAENAGLKSDQVRIFNSGYQRGHEATVEGYYVDIHQNDMTTYHEDIVAEIAEEQNPTTDAFLAEVRAQARNEGINYAAGRLAAAFNHGFVDKPLAEVFDVVRMILDTKEELANSTLPAADGLSGEYAEEFLEDSAAQLRKGVQS